MFVGCRRPVPTTRYERAWSGSINSSSRIRTSLSLRPSSQSQLASLKNQQVMELVQPLRENICGGEDIAPFRTASPDQIEKSIDDLLSIPREPLMNPCL